MKIVTCTLVTIFIVHSFIRQQYNINIVTQQPHIQLLTKNITQPLQKKQCMKIPEIEFFHGF